MANLAILAILLILAILTILGDFDGFGGVPIASPDPGKCGAYAQAKTNRFRLPEYEVKVRSFQLPKLQVKVLWLPEYES